MMWTTKQAINLQIGDCIFNKEGIGLEVLKVVPVGKKTIELTLRDPSGFYPSLGKPFISRFRKSTMVTADNGEYAKVWKQEETL